MKKKTFVLVIAVMCALCLASCGKDPKKQEYNLFFLGDSMTYYNGMPNLLKYIMNDLGYENINVDSIAYGGTGVTTYADATHEYGIEVRNALQAKKYDYITYEITRITPVTTQEHLKKVQQARAVLQGLFEENGAEKIFVYPTIARKDGHLDLEEWGWTTETMSYALTEQAKEYCEQTGDTMVNTAMAVLDAYQNASKMTLYNGDSRHPGVCGSYLIALCFAETIFGVDANDVSYKPSGVTDAWAQELKTIAHNAVYGKQ